MAGIFCVISLSAPISQVSEALLSSLDSAKGESLKISEQNNLIIGTQKLHQDATYATIKEFKRGVIVFLSSYSPKRIESMLEQAIDKDSFLEVFKLLRNEIYDFCAIFFDVAQHKLYVLTDVLASRSIYFSKTTNNICFSTSLRHVLRYIKSVSNNSITQGYDNIDISSLEYYLLTGTLPQSRTLYSNVRKTDGNSIIVFDTLTGKELKVELPLESYLKEFRSQVSFKVEEFIRKIEFALRERIDLNDKIGIALSGGLDSPVLASILVKRLCASNIRAYTVYFPGFESEVERAKEIAGFIGLDLKVISVSTDQEQLLSLFELGADNLEEPCGSAGYLGRLLVFREASKHVNSLILGEGGDELFMGYYPKLWDWNEKRPILMLSKACSTFKPLSLFTNTVSLMTTHLDPYKARFLDLFTYGDPYEQYLMSVVMINNKQVCRFFNSQQPLGLVLKYSKNNVSSSKSIGIYNDSWKSFMRFLTLQSSDVMVDRSYSSRVGVAMKLPFYDLKMLDYALSIPRREKILGATTKVLLRNAALRFNLLPKDIIDQKGKVGFTHPLSIALRNKNTKLYVRKLIENFVRNEKLRDILCHAVSFSLSSTWSVQTLLSLLWWIKNIELDVSKEKLSDLFAELCSK